MTTFDHVRSYLELGYFASQILLVIIAIVAVIVAYHQAKTLKLFEMLKFLEAPEFRRARRVVIREIEPLREKVWWEGADRERLEEAASNVCAAYDVVGRLMEFDGHRGKFPDSGAYYFFRQHWAASIVRTHDALQSFLLMRRTVVPDAYEGFSNLAKAARPHVTLTGDRTPY